MKKKVTTGIKELDKMLYDGVYEQSVTALNGASGTGKTTFGMQFIVGGIKKNEPGIIVSFEQFPEQLYRDASSFKWDFRKYEKEGKLKIVFTSPEVFQAELEKEKGLIDQYTLEIGAKRILIDPVTYFRYLAQDNGSLRITYNRLVNGIKRCGLTGFLTCELGQFYGDSGQIDEELAFVVDNIILLRYVEIESRIYTALTILKTRGSNRAKDIRRYEITPKGIEIQKIFEGREGLLTGTPRRTFAERLAKEFEL